MLVLRNIDDLGHLALPLGHASLDLRDDLIDNIGPALNFDGVSVSILLGDLNCACAFPRVIGAAGLENDVAEIRSYSLLSAW